MAFNRYGRQVFPTLYDAPGASPFEQQTFRPRPVADATNPLVQLQVQPPGPTMFSNPYPSPEQAGPTMARAALADTPLPPPRPGGLGKTLSSAVQPAAVSPRARAQAQPQAPAPATAQSLFGTTTLNPNQRNAPIYTTLNVGDLFGGLFGGGGKGAAPTATTQAQAPAPARAVLRPPDGSNWTVDADGNPVPDYGSLGPGLQPQDPTQLASTVGKANWWKSLR